MFRRLNDLREFGYIYRASAAIATASTTGPSSFTCLGMERLRSISPHSLVKYSVQKWQRFLLQGKKNSFV